MKTQDACNISFNQFCDIIDLLSPTMDDYLYVYDFSNDLYYISKQAVQRFILPSNIFGDVINTHEQFVYIEDFPALRNELQEIQITDRTSHNMMYRWVSRSGQPVWINCRGTVVRSESGLPLFLIGCINEVGKRQKADNVSGLLGEASMKSYIDSLSSEHPEGFLLRIGIDELKSINARLGNEYGDLLIRRIADIISSELEPGQKLYYVSGDEYLILDFFGGTEGNAVELYKKIRTCLEGFIARNNYEALFTISAGIVGCKSIKVFNYSNIIKLTEFALKAAKDNGRNKCSVFSQQEYDKFIRKLELIRQLRRAVNNNFIGFETYYQPIVNASKNEIFGAETLIRFESNIFGLVSPSEFVPLLEETGLIIPVGRWIMKEAFSACKRINEKLPDFHISLNISPVQIMKSNVCSEIIAVMQSFGLHPSNIIIELTESRMLESDNRFSTMWHELKNTGITIALDDFGSGYSNFRYLSALSPDIIKIDRSFTERVIKKDFEYKLLMLFCEMAHRLDMSLCIEGTETMEEVDAIKKLLPEFMQGYYFGKPCPIDEFEKLLESNEK